VRPWLYTIATHQAIDALRRQNRYQAVSLDQEREELAGADVPQLLGLLESREAGPVEQLHAEERRLLVRASVDRLPEFLRLVVVLAYYQGLKYKDVADILEIPVGTVKSRLHAALCRLHEAWATVAALNE
jgi:RNA polymerase sigma-70 factor (ECF subfamily)